MIEASQIRAMLEQVTAFQLSLDDFDGWLTRASWNMHQDSDADAIQLVGAVEGRIAEFEQGHMSARELFKAFEQITGIVRVETEESDVQVFSSGCVDAEEPFTYLFEQLADADRQLAMEFSSAPAPPASQ